MLVLINLDCVVAHRAKMEAQCWQSHLTAWQRAVDARVPACSVIENDLIPQPHFQSIACARPAM